MSLSEETDLFSLEQGCPVHGEEHMCECTMCGLEFCRQCATGTLICLECAEQEAAVDDEEEEQDDFEDVKNLGAILSNDVDAEAVLQEAAEEASQEDLEKTKPSRTRRRK